MISLNNPPTQHLVLSLRPSISLPTVVHSVFSSPFFLFLLLVGINPFVSQHGHAS